MEVFTLIMAKNVESSSEFKYHPGCKELKMTQLCFADDLLVMCHGDVDSVKIIKDSIDEFSRVSSLEPNMNKSTIFFGNVNIGEKRSILNAMTFSVGRFPIKYLGVPLITKRLGREECKQLIDKVMNKVDDWKNKALSYAGRMQLIASVLNSKQVIYLEEKLRLLGKLYASLNVKVKWVHIVKLKGKSFWEVSSENNDSWMWKCLLGLRDKAKQHIEYIVVNGKGISAWYDKWNGMGLLRQIIDSKDLYNARYDKKATVADMIHNNQRLQTQDRVFLWKKDDSMRCFLCKQSMDSHDHLFVQCNYVVEVWQNVKVIGYVSQLKQNWEDTICSMSANHCNVIKSVVCRIMFCVVVYFLWQERNKKQFTMETRPAKVLYDIILDTVRTRLKSLKVKKSTNIKKVANDWGIDQ
ncbi:RNA-directed DNA polymerase, eukaryota, reverse transcriptase zinc-binding domain protein, partial [Tanacetum coccineum]